MNRFLEDAISFPLFYCFGIIGFLFFVLSFLGAVFPRAFKRIPFLANKDRLHLFLIFVVLSMLFFMLSNYFMPDFECGT